MIGGLELGVTEPYRAIAADNETGVDIAQARELIAVAVAAAEPQTGQGASFERAGFDEAILHAVDVDEGQIVLAILAAGEDIRQADGFVRFGTLVFRCDDADAAGLEFEI